jgi:stage II sporulation protein D
MDGKTVEMELDDYLTGVLLGELPASFHTQAKMAQAVVARTYTLRTIGVKQVHPGAVCTDSTCCQAYRDPAEYVASGGSQEAVDSARQAVLDTTGQVLTYAGALIDATYFSCSGGRTEDAVAVWGADIPYLQGVDSPGEENAAHYSDTLRFTPDAFRHALGISLPGDPSGWFGTVRYTQGGGVDTMTIGGTAYTGTRLRTLLGLNSTAFRVQVKDGFIEITTKGHGHRVGMSQYGADAMARSGSTYREILNHYYTGTELEKR